MTIFIVAPYGEGFLANSYAEALKFIGHDVFWFDSNWEYFNIMIYAKNRFLRRLLRPRLWELLNKKLILSIKETRPDLVLTFKASFLHPIIIQDIRTRVGIPIVNYYPDNPYCGVPLSPYRTSAQRRDLIDCLREYTLVFNWSNDIVTRLNQDNVNSVYLPFGVDTNVFNPIPLGNDMNLQADSKIVFIGQRSKKRDIHIGAVKKNRIVIWGAMWNFASRTVKRQHIIRKERVFGEKCAVVYSNSNICLNIVDDLNMPGHNMRTFEIPACRGLMLATYTDEQNEFFPEGEAAVYYRDPLELDDIIERLLKDRKEREHIRDNAYRIAREHNYIKRAKELLKHI